MTWTARSGELMRDYGKVRGYLLWQTMAKKTNKRLVRPRWIWTLVGDEGVIAKDVSWSKGRAQRACDRAAGRAK